MNQPGRASDEGAASRVRRATLQPSALYARLNQTTMLSALILPPRSERTTGPPLASEDRSSIRAACKAAFKGIMRPLPFLAAWSRSSMWDATSPFGSIIISQVKFAISAARKPAFTESKTMALLRSGARVVWAKNRRSSICRSERIFACLRGM